MSRPQIIAPTVEARPTPGFTRSSGAPAEMFGGGGQGLAQAGQALVGIAVQAKAENDTAAIQAGDNGDAEWYRDQVRDQNGFWSRQGLDAQAAFPAYQDAVKKRIEETAATMANETQRKAYLATANRRAQMWLDRASNHVADQRKIGLDQNDDARLANLAKDAASFWGDEDAARAFMDAGTNTILDKASRNGWSPEVTRQAQDMWRAQARAGQIKQALAADPDRAAQMVEDHRAELGAAYPDLHTQVTAATKARTVDRAVNAVMEKIPTAPANGAGGFDAVVQDVLGRTARAGSEVDRSKARRRMLETDPALANDPTTRDQALAKLAHREAVDAADQAKREREAREHLYTATTAGIDPWTTDPATRAMVGPEYMAQMQAMHAKAGKVPFNYVIEGQLLAMTPDELARQDMSKLRGLISAKQHEYWTGEIRRNASAENRAALRQPSYAAAERIAGDLFPHSAKDKAAAEDNPADAANPYNRNVNARQALRSWIDQYVAENKKPPPTDEITRVGRSMQLREDKFWSPGQRIDTIATGKADTFELDTGARNLPLTAQATGIPAGDLPAVIAYAKAKGLKPTMETLIMLARAGRNQSPQTVK